VGKSVSIQPAGIAMDLDELTYDLPRGSIAQEPLPNREDSKLMDLTGGSPVHRGFSEFPSLLESGDCIVVNDSRVIPARIPAHKSTGGKAEILLVRNLQDTRWEAMVSGKNISSQRTLTVANGSQIHIVDNLGNGRYVVDLEQLGTGEGDLWEVGEMPTPPYIKKQLAEPDRYQTVYSRSPGSVAAPTAGLHLSKGILGRLEDLSVNVASITLHVGPGTFIPIRDNRVEDHTMEKEEYCVSQESARIINDTVKEGGRLIIVGTTTMRVMESCWDPKRGLVPGRGSTGLFITVGHRFKTPVGMFLTNFHLPKSTLLVMVSAYWGRERILSAYSEAVREGYRFYSFGDAMLLGPPSHREK